MPDERPRLRAAHAACSRTPATSARGTERAGRRRRVQHLRGARERRQQALRQPRPPRAGQGRAPRHADRRRRLPGAEGPRDDHRRRRRGSTSSSAPTTSARCRCCSSGRGSPEEAQVEILESLEVFPSTLPTKRESAYAAWVSISVGCNNTCTFCIVPALRGKEKDRRPGDILAEIEALVAEGVTEVTLLGQNVNAYGVEFGDRQAFSKLLRACGEVEGLERVRFTSPAPGRVHRRRHRGDGRDPQRDAVAAHAAAVGLRQGAAGHAPLLPPVEVPRHHRAGARRHARRRDHHRHHRRLPRRDRGGLPGHPRRRPRRALLRRLHLPVLQAPRHPGRRARRPGARPRSSRTATSASSSSSTRSPGRRTRRSSGARSS